MTLPWWTYADQDFLPYDWDAIFNCQATPAAESAEQTVVGLIQSGKRLITAGEWDDLADDLEVLVLHDWNPARSVRFSSVAWVGRAIDWDGIRRTGSEGRR